MEKTLAVAAEEAYRKHYRSLYNKINKRSIKLLGEQQGSASLLNQEIAELQQELENLKANQKAFVANHIRNSMEESNNQQGLEQEQAIVPLPVELQPLPVRQPVVVPLALTSNTSKNVQHEISIAHNTGTAVFNFGTDPQAEARAAQDRVIAQENLRTAQELRRDRENFEQQQEREEANRRQQDTDRDDRVIAKIDDLGKKFSSIEAKQDATLTAVKASRTRPRSSPNLPRESKGFESPMPGGTRLFDDKNESPVSPTQRGQLRLLWLAQNFLTQHIGESSFIESLRHKSEQSQHHKNFLSFLETNNLPTLESKIRQYVVGQADLAKVVHSDLIATLTKDDKEVYPVLGVMPRNDGIVDAIVTVGAEIFEDTAFEMAAVCVGFPYCYSISEPHSKYPINVHCSTVEGSGIVIQRLLAMYSRVDVLLGGPEDENSYEPRPCCAVDFANGCGCSFNYLELSKLTLTPSQQKGVISMVQSIKLDNCKFTDEGEMMCECLPLSPITATMITISDGIPFSKDTFKSLLSVVCDRRSKKMLVLTTGAMLSAIEQGGQALVSFLSGIIVSRGGDLRSSLWIPLDELLVTDTQRDAAGNPLDTRVLKGELIDSAKFWAQVMLHAAASDHGLLEPIRKGVYNFVKYDARGEGNETYEQSQKDFLSAFRKELGFSVDESSSEDDESSLEDDAQAEPNEQPAPSNETLANTFASLIRDKWRCEKCSVYNIMDLKLCECCNEPRPVPMSVEAPTSDPTPTSVPDSTSSPKPVIIIDTPLWKLVQEKEGKLLQAVGGNIVRNDNCFIWQSDKVSDHRGIPEISACHVIYSLEGVWISKTTDKSLQRTLKFSSTCAADAWKTIEYVYGHIVNHVPPTKVLSKVVIARSSDDLVTISDTEIQQGLGHIKVYEFLQKLKPAFDSSTKPAPAFDSSTKPAPASFGLDSAIASDGAAPTSIAFPTKTDGETESSSSARPFTSSFPTETDGETESPSSARPFTFSFPTKTDGDTDSSFLSVPRFPFGSRDGDAAATKMDGGIFAEADDGHTPTKPTAMTDSTSTKTDSFLVAAPTKKVDGDTDRLLVAAPTKKMDGDTEPSSSAPPVSLGGALGAAAANATNDILNPETGIFGKGKQEITYGFYPGETFLGDEGQIKPCLYSVLNKQGHCVDVLAQLSATGEKCKACIHRIFANSQPCSRHLLDPALHDLAHDHFRDLGHHHFRLASP